MNLFKSLCFISVITVLLVGFTAEVNAGRHYRSHTSVGFSFNVGAPTYVVSPPPPVIVAPAYPVYSAPVVYSYPAPYPYYYSAPVVVHPGVTYTHWGR